MGFSIHNVFFVVVIISLLAFGVAAYFYRWIVKKEVSNPNVESIRLLIEKGSDTFLRKEYTILAKFTLVVAVLVFLFLPRLIWNSTVSENLSIALAYVLGTVFSGASGIVGMKIATQANARTAEAATKDITRSFMSSFRGGAVMGMAVVGSSILGVLLVYWITGDTTALLGFSFGASALALFAKAGGGIFTKTADIAADLTGKIELGIPEDDPRNPAVIADNVGDNVGDCAGMGADLFDSHVASISAALIMAVSLDQIFIDGLNVMMVFVFAAIGLFTSIIGVLTARMGKNDDPTLALNLSTISTSGLFLVLSAVASYLLKFH